ncbi:hypothetical protein CKO32_07905 [Afifella marina DSM 2698]|uniref:Efflux transporter, outer membrane factor (OMF) lipoprotein, NodT family n=2 Tax=Afifella marina TaxID=1080 RepID=A0A1G5NIH8_AFIMA|nr:efflux transporter outer membrane subunit [Afifella marina]MBK1623486.1 hypothetical protein [Afifella marina DSM 2698]MBK1626479.1 hypothetical protein [Afifella marina]MBK5916028.1 hypothetical protein [Afifella marina]SCZ36718.1 efflux transporter, outer membrane factor (OMF) lipoprotein, NodT family [Afifella marina DSM 2698]
MSHWRLFTPLACTLVLSGCMVGPDYQGPPDAAPLARLAGAFRHADQTTPAYYPAAAWWESLSDKQLDALIVLALSKSPNVDLAIARLKQERAGVTGARANLMPTAAGLGAASGVRLGLGDTDGLNNKLAAAAATLGPEAAAAAPAVPEHVSTGLYNAAFDASWEVDIFGGRRRAVERSTARAQAAEAALADAYVQLSAEVARAYVGLRAAQRQLGIVRHSVSLQQKTFDLTRQQVEQGTSAKLDLARLETQLTSTQADIPLLEAQVEEALGQLAVLCGLEPGALDARLSKPRPIPSPPKSVPVGNPESMLRRRPDVRQAERQLASANAAIGEAVAQYFPRIKLIGLAVAGGTQPGDLADTASLSLLGGPTLQWNLLSFGRIDAKVQQSEAATEAALAEYRQSVLAALQDAESSLTQFRKRKENVAYLARASASAARAAALTRDMNEAGALSLIDTLDIERQRLQTEQSLAQAEAELTNAFIALEKSLGLGWKPATSRQPAAATVAKAN